MNVTITVNRRQTIDTLARTTGYLGSKQPGSDGDSYDRLTLSEADSRLLDQFWNESRDRLCLALRRQIDREGAVGDIYSMDLTLSSAFDTTMRDTIETGVASYFVQSMAAKWLAITDRDQAAEYASAATAALDDISRKCYCKRRPVRPHY